MQFNSIVPTANHESSRPISTRAVYNLCLLLLTTGLTQICVGCGGPFDNDKEAERKRSAVSAAISDQETDGTVILQPAEKTLTTMPLKELSSQEAGIRYIGRVHKSEGQGVVFAYPGVNVRLRFKGTRLHVLFSDGSHHKSPNPTHYFSVRIDGKYAGRLDVNSMRREYVVATELPEGVHTIELFKRSEWGKIAINGFRIDPNGELLNAAPRKLRMEFIGDSITAGYGNEVAEPNPIDRHYTAVNSNAYMAWGAIAARTLKAEYVAVANSGNGISRNIHGNPKGTIPEIYPRIFPTDVNSPLWQSSENQPHIVVINLGTNDFPGGLNKGVAIDEIERQFAEQYRIFLKRLLDMYPGARFILAIGPMLSDNSPKGFKVLSRVRRVLTKIADKYRQTNRVFVFETSPTQTLFGEDFHPTVGTHKQMSNELVTFIRKRGLNKTVTID